MDFRKITRPLSYVMCLWITHTIYANPQGLEIISGNVNVLQDTSNLLELSVSPSSILHWDSFSINTSEVTKILQESANSSVLNRVLGGSISEIFGALESNGRVYLVNGAGILVGPEGRIETAGFVGSTADILNADFLSGKELLFSADSDATIVNFGTIKASTGDIVIIAKTIHNKGLLSAPSGQVALAAATEVLLYNERSGVYIQPNAISKEISQEGIIEALQVEIKSGVSPYQYAIRHSGTIQALSTEEVNGRIVLLADKGGVQVAGDMIAPAGDVNILGDTVILESGLIDVSSANQGGSIHIGGGFQGKDDSLLNSSISGVYDAVTLRADALEKGDGGQIIIWSDGKTHFSGKISAQGGPVAGNGGFVEVSGKEGLQYLGRTNTLAPQGSAGKLLLDPKNITIDSPGTTAYGTAANWLFTASPTTTVSLQVASLANELNSNNVVLQANTDITVTASIVPSTGGHNLTLNAGGSITIATGIAIETKGGDFIATINDEGAVSGDRTPISAPTFTMEEDSFISPTFNLSATTGNVSIIAGSFGGTQQGEIILNGAVIETSGGSITLTGVGYDDGSLVGTGNGVTIQNTTNYPSGLTAGNGITITGTGVNNTTDGLCGVLVKAVAYTGPNTGGVSIDTGNSALSITGHGGGASGAANRIGVFVDQRLGATSPESGISITSLSSSQPGAGPITITGDTSVLSFSNGTPGESGVLMMGNPSDPYIFIDSFSTLTINGTIGSSSTNNQNSQAVSLVDVRSPEMGVDSAISAVGAITITGSYSSSSFDGSNCAGVFIESTDMETLHEVVISSDISTIQGDNCKAIIIDGSNILAEREAASANIDILSITGVGCKPSSGVTAGTNMGVEIRNHSSISVDTIGAIHIIGTAGAGKGNSTNNTSVRIQESTISGDADAAMIKIEGFGNSAPNQKGVGIEILDATISNPSPISSTTTGISLIANDNKNRTTGVVISTSADETIITTGAASSTTVIQGSGDLGVSFDMGAFDLTFSSTAGNLNITGIGTTTGSPSAGVSFRAGSSSSSNTLGISTNGIITVTGTGSATGTNGCFGVALVVTGSASFIQLGSSSSTVSITGTGGGTGSNGAGIALVGVNEFSTSVIRGSTITLNGIGGSGTSANYGFWMSEGLINFTHSTDATLTINATPGAATTEGIFLQNRSIIQNTQSSPSLATMNFNVSAGSAGGDMVITDSLIRDVTTSDLTHLTITTAGDFTINAGANGVSTTTGIVFAGAGSNVVVNATGDIAMDTTSFSGSPIAISSAATAANGTISLNAANISMSASGLSGSNVQVLASGNISAFATNSMSFTGPMSSTTLASSNGNVTLLVDGTSSTPGLGSFTFTGDSNLSVSGSKQLRIYTGTQSHVFISSNINGEPFVPAPFDEDTQYQQWGVVYPGGTYGGPQYTLYYKEGTPLPPTPENPATQEQINRAISDVYLLQVALAELTDRVPFSLIPYATHSCFASIGECVPAFEEYRSFVFEDDVR